MRVEEKTKRRQRRVKRVRSKMRFTVLRVVEVGVRVPEGGVEVKSEAGGEEGAGKGKGRLRMGKRVADGGKKVRDVERKTKWKRVDLASAELAVEKEGNTIGESVPLDSGKPAAQVADGEHKQLE